MARRGKRGGSVALILLSRSFLRVSLNVAKASFFIVTLSHLPVVALAVAYGEALRLDSCGAGGDPATLFTPRPIGGEEPNSITES